MGCAVKKMGEEKKRDVSITGRLTQVKNEGGRVMSCVLHCDETSLAEYRIGDMGTLTMGSKGKEHTEVPIMRCPDGLKCYVESGVMKTKHLTPGREVQLLSVGKQFGTYSTRPDTGSVVILAHGMGIARVYPFIASMVQENSQLEATLIYEEKERADLAFSHQFDTWEIDQYRETPPPETPLLTVHYVLSCPDPDWGGLIGPLTPKILSSAVPSVDDSTYYIAGPPVFVNTMADDVLNVLDVPPERVHTAVI